MAKSKQLLICLILASAIIMSNLTQAKADILFQDNFGSGYFNKWTTIGSPSLVTNPAVNGNTYSAQFSTYTNNTWTPVSNCTYLQSPYPSANTSTIEFYFQTSTVIQNDAFAEIKNGQLSPFLSLNQYKNNGTLFFMLAYPNGEYSVVSKPILSGVQTGTWYKFDITTGVTDGKGTTIKVSINDLQVFSEDNVQFDWNPTVFMLGTIIGDPDSNGSIYIGNVSVATTESVSQVTSTTHPTVATVTPITTLTPSSPSASNNSNLSSPSMLEFSWVAIVSLMVFIFAIAGLFRHRKTAYFQQ